MKTLQAKAASLKKEILLYTSNAGLEEALKLMLDLSMMAGTEQFQIVQQVKFQYKKIVLENIEGVISREQYNLEVNRIVKNVLQLAHTFEAEISKKYQENLPEVNKDDSTNAITNNELLFRCEDLGKTYKKTKFSLSQINLTIQNGEIVVVAGANAVGKTTLLRLIASDLKPDYGHIEYPLLISGQQQNYTKLKQQIAYMSQELTKWHGSLKDSIHFEAAMHGIKGAANEQAVAYILSRLGLEKYSNNTWSELSSGYKLRFHLAKALVWRPKLLILDEPLAFLDIKAQRIVLNDLRNLVKNGEIPFSVVLSSQHLQEVEEIADRFIFLNDQRIIFQGNATSINADSQTKFYEISTSASLEELKAVFSGLNCTISALYRNVFILEIDQITPDQTVFSNLSQLKKEVKHVIDITLSLKRFFL